MTDILPQIMTVVLLAVAAFFVQQTSDTWDTKETTARLTGICFHSGGTQALQTNYAVGHPNDANPGEMVENGTIM